MEKFLNDHAPKFIIKETDRYVYFYWVPRKNIVYKALLFKKEDFCLVNCEDGCWYRNLLRQDWIDTWNDFWTKLSDSKVNFRYLMNHPDKLFETVIVDAI